MATVELQNISKSFGALKVLSDIDLSIPDGEFLALVGPSGCGKSTLIRIIAGLEPQSAGSIRVDGAPIDHLRPQATLCRSAMAKRKELAGVRNRLEQRLGRLPTEAEMSTDMGLEPAAYREVGDSVDFMRTIKTALDPLNIMNPGKILPAAH